MNTIATRLIAREAVAERTMAFHFARPPGFAFKAGQSMDVLLDGPAAAGADAARHAFSIASAPSEDRVTIATRMRDSEYKRALARLAVGAGARLEGPFGSLTLHGDRSRPGLLIAGGIGITPYMSMLRQAAELADSRQLVLLYSNRRPEDSAWLEELRGLERRLPQFRLLAVMTAANRSSRFPGRIDAAMLMGALGGLAKPLCYATGSPAMVAAMRVLLNGAGVADDDIRGEEFRGY